MLTALAAVTAGPAAEALPVLGEPDPLWSGAHWPGALDALLCRRLDRYGDRLRAAVPDLDATVAGVRRVLGELPPEPRGLVHGDLCPPNILVDAAGRVVSLLDWGS